MAAILPKSLSSSNLVPSVSFRYKRKEQIFLKLLWGRGCVVFGARLLHVIDHETRTSRILFLTIDHIFQLAIDPFSHEERKCRPQSLFRYKRKAIFLNCSGEEVGGKEISATPRFTNFQDIRICIWFVANLVLGKFL